MKYGFIGCGNMGGAVARALSLATKDFCVSDRSGKAKKIAAELGVQYSVKEVIVQQCRRIFLCVKPQNLPELLKELAPLLVKYRPVIITMAAGVTTESVCNMIGGTVPVIRIMPNTPVAVGKGVVLYCRNNEVTDEMLDDFVSDMSYAGKLDMLPEKLFDPATAVSGCGPAYAYMFIDALADGAVACGVPREKALEYAAGMLAGAAEMVLNEKKHPCVLKDEVCSPGGSTIAGVRVLEQEGFRSAVINCVVAACKRSEELGKN